MDSTRLGQSGLVVSRLGLGTMTFGSQMDEDTAFRLLDEAFEAGVTLYDTAEMYASPSTAESYGRSEEILGRWLRTKPRDRVILATKLVGACDAGMGPRAPWIRGGLATLDRHHFARACEESLRRLGTDVIDLYQTHWPDRATPVEAQVEAAARLVEQGKVRYLGTSNETAWGLTRLCAVAGASGPARPVSAQNALNLLQRTVEHGLAEACLEERVGIIAFSPLAMGVLTGKYGGGARPDGARLTRFDRYGSMYLHERMVAVADAYVAVAHAHGLDPAAMAFAWVRTRPAVASVLSSCSRPDQLRPFLASADLTLSDEVLAALDTVRATHDARWNQFG